MSHAATYARETTSAGRPKLLTRLIACASLLWPGALPGQTVAVRYTEGLVHGLLSLRTLDGTALADGDLIQTARGDRVTSRLVFHFKDGSIQDETAVYSQRQRLRLMADHLVQKGPACPQPLDMSIDGASGRVTVRYADGGKEKVETERLDVPPDLANGLILTLLKNVQAGAPPKSVSSLQPSPSLGS